VVDEKEALKKDEPEEETKRKDNSKLVNFVISFYDNLPVFNNFCKGCVQQNLFLI